jgi:hypothetical protein
MNISLVDLSFLVDHWSLEKSKEKKKHRGNVHLLGYDDRINEQFVFLVLVDIMHLDFL